jgi:hypothetical protein
MKKIVLASLLLCSTVMAFSQIMNFNQIQNFDSLFKRLGLDEEEMEKTYAVIEETEELIQEADLELNIFKAQLAKSLFPVKVDLGEVERLLRVSYEWQLKRQMAQIRRQVELRMLFGEDRWDQFVRALRALQQRAAEENAPKTRQ